MGILFYIKLHFGRVQLSDDGDKLLVLPDSAINNIGFQDDASPWRDIQ